MRDFTVRDGERAVVFQGVELARRDTLGQRRGKERPVDELRWTEMAIYKTLAGTYIMEKIGRSDVYHRLPDGPNQCRGYGELTTAFYLDDEHRPCPACKPPAIQEGLESYEHIRVETDRFTMVKADTAEALVAACHNASERGGYEYLTILARETLRKTAEKDPAVDDAFSTVKVA